MSNASETPESNANETPEWYRRAEFYHKLADLAWRRHDELARTEWKVIFGLWTFFIAGTAVVMSTGGWPKTIFVPLIGTIVAVVIAIVYAVVWTPSLQRGDRRNQRTQYWWETHVMRALGNRPPIPPNEVPLPKQLRPGGGSKTESDWHTAYDDLAEEPKEWDRDVNFPRFHPLHSPIIIITCLLAALFVGALWVRCLSQDTPRVSPKTSPSKVTIEQGTVAIEGTAELSLGK